MIKSQQERSENKMCERKGQVLRAPQDLDMDQPGTETENQYNNISLFRKVIIYSGMARNDTLTMKAGEPEKIIVILLSVMLMDLIC